MKLGDQKLEEVHIPRLNRCSILEYQQQVDVTDITLAPVLEEKMVNDDTSNYELGEIHVFSVDIIYKPQEEEVFF